MTPWRVHSLQRHTPPAAAEPGHTDAEYSPRSCCCAINLPLPLPPPLNSAAFMQGTMKLSRLFPHWAGNLHDRILFHPISNFHFVPLKLALTYLNAPEHSPTIPLSNHATNTLELSHFFDTYFPSATHVSLHL